jgi:urea transport system permease protein
MAAESSSLVVPSQVVPRTSLRRVTWLRGAATLLLIGALLAAPMVLSEFRLGLLARFLTYAIVALGLDLIWGYTGILSLGHGVFFGVGAYCTAMYLKLEASGGKMPDFMAWSGVDDMPLWWKPFRFAWFALPASILIPMLLGAILGYAAFRNRIKGVFFSILSQALALVMVTLFIGQQGYTGGTNGMTNFKTFLGADLNQDGTGHVLYWVTAVTLVLAYFGCRALVNGKVGKILVAIRDGENRARFIGYDPVKYQTFVYALSAGLAGLAGMLFVLQEGLITPTKMDILQSIKMVLWVAIGGRGTLFGAALGAIVVNSGENLLSEKYPETWSYMLGASFLGVVLFLPEGIVGWVLKMANRKKREVTP